jgi:streptogramin lyase
MKLSIPLALAMAAYGCSTFSLPARAQTTVTLGQAFNAPTGVAVDGSGNVFVADYDNDAVKELLAAGGYVTVNTLGGGFSGPSGVAVDSHGNVFVADWGHNAVKEILAAGGYVTVNTLGSGFSNPSGVAVDSYGNVFVADYGNNAVKEIVAAGGYVSVNTLGSGFDGPSGVALDADGNVFVADFYHGAVKEILADSGYVAVNALGGGFIRPTDVATDGNGNVFVVDPHANAVEEILASDGYITVKPLANGFFNGPNGVAVAGGNVFVADTGNNAVKEILAGPATLFASVLPGSRSVQLGDPATIFATMINAGTTTAYACSISLTASAPPGLSMSYQTTDPTTNALVGLPNTPATLPGNNGSQSFLITFNGTNTFSAPAMPLDFGCASGNALNAAPIAPGVDTVDLAMSSNPVADIIALAATPTHNGVIEVPTGGIAAFAVASTNVGVTAPITVSVDSGTAALPITATICQTNPSTAQCLTAPEPSVALTYAGGADPTFSVFLQANGPIAFAPAASRIFVRFEDSGNGIHGSTSVAIETVP